MTTTTPTQEPQKKRKRQAVKRFIDRNRMNLGLSISFVLQLFVVLFWRTPNLDFSNKLDHLIDEVAFIDNVQIQEAPGEAPPDDGEIELTEKKKVEIQQDPRISGAQDAAIVGATAPVDLTPGVKPEYTELARAEGITGTITLEVVIADTGEVLQARSVGKKLGAGLEESAVSTYKRKRFSPSVLEGKAITVKVLIPIRFSLN
jgi:TonB family protein